MQQFLQEKDELGKIVSGHNMHEKPFHPVASSETVLNFFFLYMFRVMRKENLNTQLGYA